MGMDFHAGCFSVLWLVSDIVLTTSAAPFTGGICSMGLTPGGS